MCNTTQARALRAAGDVAGAQEEILRQIQRSGDFRQQDVFTQRALAEAAGMTVDEIARQLTTQDKLNSLSADQRELAEQAIAQGLDITNINDAQLQQEVQRFALQKEQQGAVANLSNAFQGIAATLGSSIVPLIETLTPLLKFALFPITVAAEGLKVMADFLKKNTALAVTLAGVMLVIYRRTIGSAIASIYKSFSQIPLGIGIPLAVAATVGLISTINKERTKRVGDAYIDPNRGPVMFSPREGGLFQGTPNDAGILAPPSVFQNTTTQTTEVSMDGVIRELKGLRKEFGKTRDTYIDGMKVTSRIVSVADESTRNNFSLT